jgi:toxin ParE1/3/4
MAGPRPVRYSAPALSEIDAIFDYIAKDNPSAAADVLAAIAEAVELLALYPRKSRRTQQRGLRAIPLSGYPYIVFFKIKRGELEVVHVLHGARRHPGFQEELAGFTD